jgi:hypothetical protein
VYLTISHSPEEPHQACHLLFPQVSFPSMNMSCAVTPNESTVRAMSFHRQDGLVLPEGRSISVIDSFSPTPGMPANARRGVRERCIVSYLLMLLL